MLKKIVLISAIAGLLAAASSVSLADNDRRGYRNDHRKDYRNDYRNNHRWDRRDRRAYNRGYWRGGRYYAPRYYYNGWGPSPYRGWGQAYLGGALLGSALTYSVVHNHSDCNDHSHNHSLDSYRDGPRYEITGCYRIEQLPDGRERRIELPLSECR